jgi:hypothetical protein
MFDIFNKSGESAGFAVKKAMDTMFTDVGPEMEDKLAGALGSMNWNSIEDWEQLPALLESMGIPMTESVMAFIE